jgi:spermidine synthase
MLPFCAAMGATYPLAVAVLGRLEDASGARSFSYLYVANTVGATAGALVSAFVLIEVLGFRDTLWLVAFLDASLAASAFALSFALATAVAPPSVRADGSAAAPDRPATALPPRPARGGLAVLFLTGLASMGMEVVWLRQLTPYLGNLVYTFAIVLGTYLTATFTGALLYRRWAARGRDSGVTPLAPEVWAVVAVLAMLPVAAADPRLPLGDGLLAGTTRAVLGIAGFCAALGFVTPFVTDRWSRGEPRRVGNAYAVNVLGCIAGPLVAGFALLPRLGEIASLIALAVPLLLLGVAGALVTPATRRSGLAWSAIAATALALALQAGRSFESLVPDAIVRRDTTATVTVTGRGFQRRILVNGIGMTYLSTITKMMAHLPLAHCSGRPERALVVCFGMGTSYRSALSWGIPTTAVELVPSVPALFGEFHADAAAILASPLGRIVVDDGRRFLERTTDTYSAIVIDPPPPLSAAGSSLLYSREFCLALRRRLAPGGIVQHWIPAADPLVVAAALRAVTETFPHVRVFASAKGRGLHVLASAEELPVVSAAVLAGRLPARAAADLLEWSPSSTAEGQFANVLGREMPLATLLRPDVPALTDDRPVNEYFVLRETFLGS